MKPTKAQIQAEMTKLRAIVDDATNDPLTKRIAYTMEAALDWATTGNTNFFKKPSTETFLMAAMLKEDIEWMRKPKKEQRTQVPEVITCAVFTPFKDELIPPQKLWSEVKKATNLQRA